ncbi:dolichyl-phosphate beta-glucosyltransferase [Cladophialophora yegresii CBS 114405]|uniref:dolichyl-phosphate beta-glucosyltransferase n=1 Tax=Cladophialophora yegresii CBS 114405 TaxID=1182544 RepID=W9WDP5_9EURO|nr:dolichyl-phosphate beta-glucosyltransferase [Cladophialophora yegresii CBS 114405]EXJ63120.1 dolichyl-phosphate beta-glucosyltransferase [Cladophialophora yegresii CBS 114405]
MANEAATPMAFSGQDRSFGMSGHFMNIFRDDKWLNWRMVPFILIWAAFAVVLVVWLFIYFFVPEPRRPRPSEKTYTTVDKTGDVTDPEPLPCWYDDLLQRSYKARQERPDSHLDMEKDFEPEPPEVFLTLVIPAFNEEDRLSGMLEEAVNFLQTEYGVFPNSSSSTKTMQDIPEHSPAGPRHRKQANGAASKPDSRPVSGWEILLIDDGSTDHTLLTAQTFARAHILPPHPRRDSGPWTHRSPQGVKIPPGSIRMVSLEENRGKGGAVTHGMRHARGQYVLFADADGASKFSDLTKLLAACRDVEDPSGRGIAVGSRAHLVGSEAVVKRSRLRNFLMHAFHLLLWLLTPPATARIKDTQCGFKLFSRPTLPFIIPHMHMEGWIFDVEMLMLAESAGIPVAEVHIGWREVVGSKLNVVKDSIGMAWGLAILRICWGTGIYRR